MACWNVWNDMEIFSRWIVPLIGEFRSQKWWYGFVLYYASLLTNPLYCSWMQHCSWFLVRVSVFCWFLVAIHLHFLLMPDIFLFMFQNVSKKLLFAVRKDGWSPVERYPQPCWLMGIVRWYGLVPRVFYKNPLNCYQPNRSKQRLRLAEDFANHPGGLVLHLAHLRL